VIKSLCPIFFSSLSEADGVKKKYSFCLITYSPLGKAGITPLLNLIKIFRDIGLDVCLISGGDVLGGLTSERNVYLFETAHKIGSNFVTRIFNHLCMQVKMLSYVVKASTECDFFVIFLGESLIMPILALKIMGKKPTLMLGITPSKKHFVNEDVFSKLWVLLININMRFADRLIVYSNKIIQDSNLTRYRHKIILAHEHSVDFTEFYIEQNLNERRCIIGYVGRLSRVKGTLNLVQAIPLLSQEKEMTFLIAGTGELYSEIERFIRDNELEAQVTLAGWIPHNDLPRTLNKLKLLVLPSYSEALPNILLEAMACGTPVLATPVGAIPDIIKDGETGFLLESNDPKHIADKIVELLGKPELLEKVSKNAYKWVRENFNQEKTLDSWQRVF
jgi:glycosyltransferase involved in cell wall biosynthesis